MRIPLLGGPAHGETRDIEGAPPYDVFIALPVKITMDTYDGPPAKVPDMRVARYELNRLKTGEPVYLYPDSL